MCKLFVEKYKNLSDDELIILIRENDQDAFEFLFNKYLPLIKKIILKNSYIGIDYDDMMQDAGISFYYAAQMYDFNSSSFSTYLSVCVDRSLKSTLRRASAQKRIPKDLIVPIDDSNETNFKTQSAEEEFFTTQSHNDTVSDLKGRLSELEFSVLKSYLNTESYDLTAKQLKVSKKTVDNALLRIRKKFNS